MFTAGAAIAGSRASANYSIITDIADSGGGRTTTAAYTNDGSAGAVTGLSTVATVEVFKSGYAGQLYDVTGLSVTSTANPVTVNGGATLPLGAWQNLDDGSFLAVAPGSVTWSVVSGPITGISSGGLAQAGAVSQNTAATVRGAYGGHTGSLGLMVDVPVADFTSRTQMPIVSNGYTATGSSIALGLGFAPTTGTVLTLVNNTGINPIQGTFSNLTQGQTVNLTYGGQNYGFVANYSGGSNGNSLVLQLVTQAAAMPAWAWLTLGALLAVTGARKLVRKNVRAGRIAA